jgi:hydroxypyruvate reductase
MIEMTKAEKRFPRGPSGPRARSRAPAVTPGWSNLREDLDALHRAALAAADPADAVRRALRLSASKLVAGRTTLDLEPESRIVMVAFGKAAPGMARAALSELGGRVQEGVVIHPHDGGAAVAWPEGIRDFAAGHPVPDAGSLRAGEAALEVVRHRSARDVVLVLGSGGGSALCEALRPGVTLEDVRETTAALQRAGADVVELNVVRRALSRVKGGGLSRAARPARVVTLLLSDVVGDRIASIASGPTVEAAGGAGEALEVLERYGLLSTRAALERILTESDSAVPERNAGAPGPVVEDPSVTIVGSNRIAGEAVRVAAEARGFRSWLLTDRLQGEAREIGRALGGLARGISEAELPCAPPACLVFGGETTVTVRGDGRGGRNLELALGAGLALEGCAKTALLSFATDGRDGSSEAAGALATGETIARARALGLSPHRALEENDTAPFFAALGDLWVPGPSGTNVNDLTVVLAYPR